MKLIHNLAVSVFIKPEDEATTIKQAFLSFFPFDLEKEKIKLIEKSATGFQERKIVILEVTLAKERHIKPTFEALLNRLTKEQKELLIKQKESRLDEDLEFFIRFDKTKLIKENKYLITDSGNCFHLKLSIASFPAKREIALAIIDKIFK